MVNIELCAVCDKRACGATIILSALAGDKKRFNSHRDSIELICPACGKSFAVPITELERVNVSESELHRVFLDGRLSARAGSAGTANP